MHPHDFITLTPRTKHRIYERCAPLYEKGLSLRDIEVRTGIPKTTIRETLNSSGFALRSFSIGSEKAGDRKQSKRCGHTPYGFAYLDGQLVIDPKEHLIVRKILKLHQSDKSNQAIADELNNQKIPTRLKRKWQKSVIHSIIKRHKENQ